MRKKKRKIGKSLKGGKQSERERFCRGDNSHDFHSPGAVRAVRQAEAVQLAVSSGFFRSICVRLFKALPLPQPLPTCGRPRVLVKLQIPI